MGMVVPFLLVVACSLVTGGLNENYMAVDHMDCFCAPPICVNLSCALVKLDPFKYGLTFRAFITKALSKITLQIRKYQMTPKKLWKISNININIDYCEFAKGANNPIMTVFAPGLREKLGNALRPCPYEGEVDVKNYTFQMDRTVVRIPKGTQRKVDVKFLSSKLVPMVGFTLYNKVV